ncbi:MAG: thiamine phosphate synthase [Rhodospirillales bacterium]|nr:thiamine phosphate synthase [Rhodospirillales bacterium]
MNLANISQQLNSSYRLRNKSIRRTNLLPTMIFMTDTLRVPNPLSVVKKLPKGAAVIFRHYNDPNRLYLLHKLRKECQRRGLIFLIAGDFSLAKRFADGAHFPEGIARKAAGKIKKPRPNFIITTAAHNYQALAKAQTIDVNAVLFSPVFSTKSHEGTKALGLIKFAKACQFFDMPIYALGGISANYSRRIFKTRAAGIAGISGFLS